MHSKPLLAPALLLAASLASATNLFDPSVSSTPAPDGSSVRLDGTLNDTNGNPEPWVIQVYAGLAECLRLFVNSAAFDAKLVVVAPDGTVFRDDDSGGQLRPLVEIASTPVQGWYTVQVAQFAGLPQNANFEILYGRYTPGNANCSAPTSPLDGVRGNEIQKEISPAPAQVPKDPGAP